MAAYVVFCMTDVGDPEALRRYRLAARPSLERHAPRFLCGPNVTATLEGESLDGLVVLEFDSMEAAQAWYTSPDYQEAASLRKSAATMLACIVQGR